MKKRIFTILSCMVTMCMALFVLAGCGKIVGDEMRTFNIDKDTLKVGVISDSQLYDIAPEDPDTFDKWKDNAERSFATLKTKDVDMILFAGDMIHQVSDYAYETYMNAFYQAYPIVSERPILQTIMGNHEYYNASVSDSVLAFEKHVGHSPWTHYVVNGYHFIGVSPQHEGGTNAYTKTKSWIKDQIEIAREASPGKPIFVLTHSPGSDTVYGSDGWSDKSLNKILGDYEEVVNISGHSHYALVDERSIHQRDYTSIQTQAISYTELEEGRANGSKPPFPDETPMGIVLEISSDEVEIARYNMLTGVEQKADSRWTLPIPLTQESFTYTDSRADSISAPTISGEGKSHLISGERTYIEFPAGTDNDFVHHYELEWSKGDNTTYFTDFYHGLDDMQSTVKLTMYGMKKGTYDVKVYAVNSFGKKSSGFIEINDVVIEKTLGYDMYHEWEK